MTPSVIVTKVRLPELEFVPALTYRRDLSTSNRVVYSFEVISSYPGFSSSSRADLVLYGAGELIRDDEGNLIWGTITRIDFANYSTSWWTGLISGIQSDATFRGGAAEFHGLSLSAPDFWTAWLAATDDAGRNALRGLVLPAEVVFVGDSTQAPTDSFAVDYTGYERDDVFGSNEGNFNDVLIGHQGHDILISYGGDDYLNGGVGNDVLLAGEGADLVYGEAGNDQVWGGPGTDILILGDDDDLAFGEAGDDAIYGQAGIDVLDGGDGADFLPAGEGNDSVYGGAGNDYLMGEAGDDILSGDDGDDVLVGGPGADVLLGGASTNAYFAGAGNDYLVGGPGQDYYYLHWDGVVANELDIVHGFDAGTDYLVLAAAYQSATSVLDSGGYTWVLTSVGGSSHAVAVIGSSAPTVSAQIIWT